MRNVLDRLELLAAWLKPGGEHPSEPIPDKYSTLVEAIAEITRLRAQLSAPADGKCEELGCSESIGHQPGCPFYEGAPADGNPEIINEVLRLCAAASIIAHNIDATPAERADLSVRAQEVKDLFIKTANASAADGKQAGEAVAWRYRCAGDPYWAFSTKRPLAMFEPEPLYSTTPPQAAMREALSGPLGSYRVGDITFDEVIAEICAALSAQSAVPAEERR